MQLRCHAKEKVYYLGAGVSCKLYPPIYYNTAAKFLYANFHINKLLSHLHSYFYKKAPYEYDISSLHSNAEYFPTYYFSFICLIRQVWIKFTISTKIFVTMFLLISGFPLDKKLVSMNDNIHANSSKWSYQKVKDNRW